MNIKKISLSYYSLMLVGCIGTHQDVSNNLTESKPINKFVSQRITLADNNQLRILLPNNLSNLELESSDYFIIKANLQQNTEHIAKLDFSITHDGKLANDGFNISSFSSSNQDTVNGASLNGCALKLKNNQCVVLIKINKDLTSDYNLEIYENNRLIKAIPFKTIATPQNKHYLSAEQLSTKTPVKHLIVLVEENEAFDKMFGTYPYAANPIDENSPRFYGVVGNKIPNNYLKVDVNSYPIDATGDEIHHFDQAVKPQFNFVLTNNHNGVNPYRLNYNTYMCSSSHQYDDELWAYGIVKFGDANEPGDLSADKFIKYAGAGIGGGIVTSHLTNISNLMKRDYPYYRTIFGWACLSPANHMRNIYNSAGETNSNKSISPNLELMEGSGMMAGTILDPNGSYRSGGRKYYTERFGQTMGYWDGNSVQALWNYAQNFTISDNYHQLTYGPSTIGHLSLVYGATGPLDTQYTTSQSLFIDSLTGWVSEDGNSNYYMRENLNPVLDVCSNPNLGLGGEEGATSAVLMRTTNIGSILSIKQISWGWFAGGFRNLDKESANCAETGLSHFGTSVHTYQSAIEPFQFSPATANPLHLPPKENDLIGGDGQANHQYDLRDLITAMDNDQLPAVAFVKPKNYQNGHGDTSSPPDEQNWLVNFMNKVQQSAAYQRGDTAIIITEDDSDGGYDHVITPPHKTYNNNTIYGLGPRLVFILISPYAKHNFIDSTLTDQASIIKFIKYNWQLESSPINSYSKENNSGSILNMFDFTQNINTKPVLLYCDGSLYDGSTNTPAPVLTTFNGVVTRNSDSNINEYKNLIIPADSIGLIASDRDKIVRKTGYETSNRQYECANQFGY